MGPGTGSHIASDMRQEGRITLGISDRGAPPKVGSHIATTAVLNGKEEARVGKKTASAHCHRRLA